MSSTKRAAHLQGRGGKTNTTWCSQRETLALLNRTKAALKKQQQQCCTIKLAEQEQGHQAKLKRREETFQNKFMEAKQELAQFQTKWEAKEEAWSETRGQLEDTI